MALDLTIRYCASCGYLSRALWMAGEILAEIQADVASLTLLPGDRGIFDWLVNGEVAFSKGEMGRFPDLDELKENIYSHLER